MQGVHMEAHEREYFISRVRCGYYRVSSGGQTFKILPPHIEDIFLAAEYYEDVYYEAAAKGIMCEAETKDWMIDNNLWSYEEEQKIELVEKEIENLQVKIYQYRLQPTLVKQGKHLLRQAEKALKDLEKKRDLYSANTCEGIAYNEQAKFLFEKSCYLDGKPYDFKDYSSQNLFYLWASQILSESQIRELCRKEPWRSFWSLKEISELFKKHENRDLNVDQKNLVTWSKMFDNIYESMDCPTEEVLDDPDMLNGWLVLQRKEAEKSKQEKSADSMLSDKIAGAQEVMLMARSQEEANVINKEFNSSDARRIQKDRLRTVRQKGKATDLDFKDKRMELQNQANEQYKRKFR